MTKNGIITTIHRWGTLETAMQELRGSYHSPAKILNTVNIDPPKVLNDHLHKKKNNL